MNIQYLLEHTVQITSAPLKVFTRTENGVPELLCNYSIDGRPAPEPPERITQFVMEHCFSPLPELAVLDSMQYYALVPQKETIYLLGPIRLSASLALRHSFHSRSAAIAADSSAAICDVPVFLHSVLLLFNLLSSGSLSYQDLLSHNCLDKSNVDVQKYYSSLVYENRENGQKHNSYSQEHRLMSSIERGDLRMVEKCQQERLTGSFGKLSNNADRNFRNICISAITLSSRAAIRGGVNPELAFSLCDSYIMKIEDLHNLNDLQPLVEGAQLNFASMVRQLKVNNHSDIQSLRHPLIEKCKNYIYSHLHGKITVGEVAGILGTNPNYLSSQFKKYEGISFSEFVIREKISLAKNLLIYSQDSYGEIAATLGFASQSHMGKHFKEITGMTPIQFRKRFAITEISG